MFTNELQQLQEQINKLKKKDIELIISDFDDTIFSRTEQLEDSKTLRENRGKAGNKKILNDIGLEYYGNKYYKDKKYPETIISKFNKGFDLILTAGNHELQTIKLTHTGLINHNHIIVTNPEDKIIETIKYITTTLKFIPKKITIYEDRPHFFIEYKNIIENALDTKIDIMFVEMKNNYTEPKITKIA